MISMRPRVRPGVPGGAGPGNIRDRHRDLGDRVPPGPGLGGLSFLDSEGYPIQRRGVTTIPGLYILGLDWLHTAASGIFPGIGDDAAYLAAQIAERANAA